MGALPSARRRPYRRRLPQVRGLVVLEGVGHAALIGLFQAEVFHAAMHNLLSGAHRRMPAG
ncbi:hypothetical protein [Nonomuraea sp. GTA35]|uniref:hypothetical protein n=1 Tax=Nonomuraea sp. GTA35 TaxID=1676746 RepID=UPI0035C18726